MKAYVQYLTVFSIATLLLWGCVNESKTERGTGNDSDAITVTQAKAAVGEYLGLGPANSKDFITLPDGGVPEWDRAIVVTDEEASTLYVPVRPVKKIFAALNQEFYDRPIIFKPARQLIEIPYILQALKMKETGKIYLYLRRDVPNIEGFYGEGVARSYSPEEDRFNGKIVYTSLDGYVINTLLYRDGKQIDKAYYLEPADVLRAARSRIEGKPSFKYVVFVGRESCCSSRGQADPGYGGGCWNCNHQNECPCDFGLPCLCDCTYNDPFPIDDVVVNGGCSRCGCQSCVICSTTCALWSKCTCGCHNDQETDPPAPPTKLCPVCHRQTCICSSGGGGSGGGGSTGSPFNVVQINCSPNASSATGVVTTSFGAIDNTGILAALKDSISLYPQWEWGTGVYNIYGNIVCVEAYSNYLTNKIEINIKFEQGISTLATLHTHPTNSPFSTEDIFSLIELNGMAPSYEVMYLMWSDCSTFMALHLENTQKANQFRDSHNTPYSIDQLNREIVEMMYLLSYNNSLSEREKAVYALDFILEKYDTGLSIYLFDHTQNGFKKRNTEIETDSNGNFMINRLTKCN